jgi:inactivated superfamily I helicase
VRSGTVAEAQREQGRHLSSDFLGLHQDDWHPSWGAALAAETFEQARLLREVVSNPFRPLAVNPAWQTPAVLALAQAAYDNRILPAGTLEPERLAVLADALEEAGCTNSELLDHLRSNGTHVRGCWAVDLVLGRE